MSKRRIEVMDPFIKKKRLVTRFQAFVVPCFNSSFTCLCFSYLIKLSVVMVTHISLRSESLYFQPLKYKTKVRNLSGPGLRYFFITNSIFLITGFHACFSSCYLKYKLLGLLSISRKKKCVEVDLIKNSEPVNVQEIYDSESYKAHVPNSGISHRLKKSCGMTAHLNINVNNILLPKPEINIVKLKVNTNLLVKKNFSFNCASLIYLHNNLDLRTSTYLCSGTYTYMSYISEK